MKGMELCHNFSLQWHCKGCRLYCTKTARNI